MKNLFKFLCGICAILITIHAYAHPTEENDADFIRQSMSDFMQQNQIPGAAVQVYVNGEPKSYYFGYRDQEKKLPVNKYTIFELGSISKIMTGLLLAQQVDTSSIQLDDALTKYMYELPETFDSVSIKSLATHTSGLPFEVPKTVKSRLDLEKYLAEWLPENKPGAQWIYSNVGIGILGYILENLTHKRFEELYRSRITSPLGMEPVAFDVPKRFKIHYAQGYDANNQPVPPAESGLFPAAYQLKASAIDMQYFLSAAIGIPGTPAQIFYPIRLTQTAFVRLPGQKQGLAWLIHSLSAEQIPALLDATDELNLTEVNEVFEKPRFDGNALIDKTGMTNGFQAYMAVIPNRKSGIVILVNKSIPNHAIVKTARKILFKLALEP